MAETQGIDLTEESQCGNVSEQELVDATFRCTGCSNVAACEALLGSADVVTKDVPNYCKNADLFHRLDKAES